MKNTVGRGNYMRKVEGAKRIETIGMPRHEMALFFIAYVAAMLGMVHFLGAVLLPQVLGL